MTKVAERASVNQRLVSAYSQSETFRSDYDPGYEKRKLAFVPQ